MQRSGSEWIAVTAFIVGFSMRCPLRNVGRPARRRVRLIEGQSE